MLLFYLCVIAHSMLPPLGFPMLMFRSTHPPFLITLLKYNSYQFYNLFLSSYLYAFKFNLLLISFFYYHSHFFFFLRQTRSIEFLNNSIDWAYIYSINLANLYWRLFSCILNYYFITKPNIKIYPFSIICLQL